MATVQALAAKLAAAFETRNRDNGAEFVTLRDGAPEWMTEVIHAAHGDMLPDDWRYAAIKSLAEDISDASDVEDERHEIVDGNVEIYTSRLTGWLASDIRRINYCDEAAEEYYGGAPSREDGGLIKLLQIGQYRELDEVFGLMLSALEEIADEGDYSDDE